MPVLLPGTSEKLLAGETLLSLKEYLKTLCVLAPDVNNTDKAVIELRVSCVVRSTRYPVPGTRSFCFSSGFATGIFDFG